MELFLWGKMMTLGQVSSKGFLNNYLGHALIKLSHWSTARGLAPDWQADSDRRKGLMGGTGTKYT